MKWEVEKGGQARFWDRPIYPGDSPRFTRFTVLPDLRLDKADAMAEYFGLELTVTRQGSQRRGSL